MRAFVLMAVGLTALAACDMPQEAAFRQSPSNDYYEAVGLTEIGRKFRREAPFYVDMSAPDALDAEARERLAGQAAWMKANPSLRFLIVAMARTDGGAVAADDPAHSRAAAVAAHLEGLGVETDRLRARVVPIGVGNVEFDPLQRVTTLVEDGIRSGQPAVLAALAREGSDAASAGRRATSDADFGSPARSSASATGNPGRTSGPASDSPRGGATGDPGGSGSGGSGSGGSGSGGSSTGGSSTGGSSTGGSGTGGSSTGGSGTSDPGPSGPSSGPSTGPGPSDPGPSNPGAKKNDAKREANSGRGNGDENGDPGRSGGRNRGGDELG